MTAQFGAGNGAERVSEEAAAIDRELEALAAAQEEATLRMQRARTAQRKKALGEMSAARERAERARERVRAAEDGRSAALAALDETPFGDMEPAEAARRAEKDTYAVGELMRLAEKLPPVKLAYIPLALAALAFLLAFILPWKVECAAVGCILILLFVVMFTRLQGLRQTKADTLADRQRILDAYGVSDPGEITGLLERHRTLWREKERAEFRLEEAEAALAEELAEQKRGEAQTLGALDFTRGDSEAAQAGREVEALRAQIAALREKRAALESGPSDEALSAQPID